MPGKILMTVEEAAADLAVSGRRVRAMIADGRLPASKFGKSWMIRRSDLAKVRDRKPGRPRTIEEADDGVKE